MSLKLELLAAGFKKCTTSKIFKSYANPMQVKVLSSTSETSLLHPYTIPRGFEGSLSLLLCVLCHHGGAQLSSVHEG